MEEREGGGEAGRETREGGRQKQQFKKENLRKHEGERKYRGRMKIRMRIRMMRMERKCWGKEGWRKQEVSDTGR